MSKKSSKKAVRVVRRVLADGTHRTYTYSAYKPKPKASGDTVGALIKSWQDSPEWRRLAPSTQNHYTQYIRPLVHVEGVPAAHMTRRDIVMLRNALAKAVGPGAADGFIGATSAMFAWGVEAGWLDLSPVYKVRRIGSHELPAWSEHELELALQHLPEFLKRPLVLAVYTGQRRSDLIAMTWAAYEGSVIKVIQQKTKTRLTIPVHPELQKELDQWERAAPTILLNKFGRPWTGNNLSKQLAQALAVIEGFPPHRNIHGLRKLSAARLAEAECSPHQIASITGHRSLSMIEYYTRSTDQQRLAESAIVRLSEYKRRKTVLKP